MPLPDENINRILKGIEKIDLEFEGYPREKRCKDC